MSTKQPLVSIIIPCYNSARFLRATLQSCLAQTWKNIEIVIVDDGSTDESLEVIKSFDTHVRWDSGPNRGACAARNRGLELAEGDYIQFLDADDLLSPNKIQTQLSELEGHSVRSVAYCKWGMFREADVSDVIFKDRKEHVNYSCPLDMLLSMWMNDWYLPSHSWIFHRSLVEESGGWREDLSQHDDWEFFTRLLLRANSATFVREATAYYRKGHSSLSSAGPSDTHIRSQLQAAILREEAIRRQEDTERVRVAAARNYYTLALMFTVYGDFEEHLNTIRQRLNLIANPPPYGVGGRSFQLLTKAIGFWGALHFKKVQMRAKRCLGKS